MGHLRLAGPLCGFAVKSAGDRGRDDTPCSLLTLEQPFESFLTARPQMLRRNLRRYKAKAEAIGALEFKVSDTAAPELLDALIRLHGIRWARAGEDGMIAANRAEAFLREVADVLAQRGWLRILALRFAGRIATIILAMCNETTIFSYLSAFDPEHEAFGFGRELLARSFRYAQESGYRRWNFLRGEEAYKFEWGAQPVAKCRVVIRP